MAANRPGWKVITILNLKCLYSFIVLLLTHSDVLLGDTHTILIIILNLDSPRMEV